MQADGEGDVSTPNTTKLICWIQPLGPASSALTGPPAGRTPAHRNASAQEAAVNSTGPAMPAQAPAEPPGRT